jgi:hypothetical protein
VGNESVFLDYDLNRNSEIGIARKSIESIFQKLPEPKKISQLRRYISNDDQYEMVSNAKKKKHQDASLNPARKEIAMARRY